MTKVKSVFHTIVFSLLLLIVWIGYSWYSTESTIQNFRDRVIAIGKENPIEVYSPKLAQNLPEPVKKYFAFVFQGQSKIKTSIEFNMEGEFRRPLTEKFEPTTAEQTIAIGTPALAFSATTPIIKPVLWARPYDAFIGDEMEMKAKLNYVLTVVNEKGSPTLNKISLRRWLMESPMYPEALLPGGPVRWEAMDSTHSKAIVSNSDGLEATAIATFRSDGSLESFSAEEDGDLKTPYHGSGEYAFRNDYELIDGMMIPHTFMFARMADNKKYPFWKGKVLSIKTL